MQAVIFDLDSTLADTRHRQHMIKKAPEKTDWEAYSMACVDDTPIAGAIALTRYLNWRYFDGMPATIIVTGRSGAAKEATQEWLADNGVEYDRLIMRPEGNRTPNPIFKTAVVAQLIEAGYEIKLFVDDYAAVAEAINAKYPEIPVLLVNPGYHGEAGA